MFDFRKDKEIANFQQDPVVLKDKGICIHNQQEAGFYSVQNIRIITDCLELLKKTTKIDTYFSRLNLLRTNLNCLIQLEAAGYKKLRGLNSLPSEILRDFILSEKQLTNCFIDRFYQSTNNMNICYQELEAYKKYMSPENVEYYTQLYNKYLDTQRISSFKNLGVQKYKIVGTLDSTTCSKCGEYDMQVFNISDYKKGVTAPPFHDGCRCTTAPAFDDEFEYGERAARNMDGKTYYVPRNISYKEWKKKYIDSDPLEKQKFEIIRLKEKNFESDYNEYVKYQTSNIFKKIHIGRSISSFQDIKYNNPHEYAKIKAYYKLYICKQLTNDITYTKWRKIN